MMAITTSGMEKTKEAFIRGKLTPSQEADLRISVPPDEWERLLSAQRRAQSSTSFTLGELPVGAVVNEIGTALVCSRPLVVIATNKGVFVAEVGKSKLTKLEPLDAG